jgi:hypothetical protein
MARGLQDSIEKEDWQLSGSYLESLMNVIGVKLV